jgi:hypothetical protein
LLAYAILKLAEFFSGNGLSYVPRGQNVSININPLKDQKSPVRDEILISRKLGIAMFIFQNCCAIY